MEKNNYEIAYLVKNKEDAEAVGVLLGRYKAEMIHKGAPIEKRLAYPIKKYNIAYFGYFQFKAPPDAIEKILQSLKLNSAVIRALLVKSPILKETKRRRITNDDNKNLYKSSELPEESNVNVRGGMLTNEALEETLEKILK